MAYVDPITKNTYPSKDWMMANINNLPEVKAAYGTKTPTPVATVAPATTSVAQPLQLTNEQVTGLKAIQSELAKRAAAGTPANETLTGVPVTPVAPAGTTNVSTLGVSSTPDLSKITTTTAPTTNIPATATATTEISDNIQKKIEEENKAYQAKLEADQKAEEERLKASMGTSATGYEGLAELAKQTPTTSIEAKLAEENAKAGITALQQKLSTQTAKITAIQNEIAQDEATQTAEVENARTRLSSMEMISSDINEINYKYNLQKAKKTALLGAEAAVAQVYQGDLTAAKNSVADIVNAYTADKQSEVNKFENLFNVYSNWTSSLDASETAILKNAHETAINDLETAKTDATNVMNMMIQYPSAGIQLTDSTSTAATKASEYQNTHKDESAVLTMQYNNPGAGILPTDTLQTATQKAEAYQIAHKDEADVIKLQSTYLDAGILSTDTLQQALKKASDYSKLHPEVAQTVGSAETGYTMKDKYGNTIGTIAGSGTTTDKSTIFDTPMQEVLDNGGSVQDAVDAANSISIAKYSQPLSVDDMNKLLTRAMKLVPNVKKETPVTINETTSSGVNNTPAKKSSWGTTNVDINNGMNEIGSGLPDTTSWFNQLFGE